MSCVDLKQTHPKFPGVVAEWPGCRLIVGGAPDGSVYYRLQVLAPSVGALAPAWVPVDRSSSGTLSALLKKLAASCSGLSDAVHGLPDDPREAIPLVRVSQNAGASV